jgi:hypothetical protein
MALIERLRQDDELVAVQKSVALTKCWDLARKFKIVASALSPQPLGLCGLTSMVEYSIERITVQGSRVFVHTQYPKKDQYQLPKAYANLVTVADMVKINSGVVKYTLVWTIKNAALIEYISTTKIIRRT